MKITGDYTIGMLWLTIETILLKKNSEWGVTLPVFILKGVMDFILTKFHSGVSKIADFRHVDMEGQMKGALPV